MGGMYAIWSKWLGPTVLCCTCVALPALSASPLEKVLTGKASQPSTLSSVHHTPLDLRPPTLTGTTQPRFAEFGRQSETGEDKRLASLGAAMNQERPSNRTEAFIQRFHREGLPLARLWQGHAAVVSVGLNPKGKPGLWLVKQTH
jgi:hypothetical protein